MKDDKKNKAFSCMDNPFLIGNDNAIFSAHDELGFIVHKGGFVGKDRFVSMHSIINMFKRHPGIPIILNIGDSSTSGWHSDSLSRNGKNKATDPYFHYKTYSDLMREEFVSVINAGVSKYASLQGAKYLSNILRSFAKNDIYPSYVTIYLGNNDSVYSEIEDKTSIDGMLPSKENTLQRVSPLDFEHNMLEIVRICRCYGARPIIIVPLRRYDWAPGLRSLKYAEEYEKGLKKLRSDKLREELQQARQLYLKRRLREAYESDRFLPRIKQRYVDILRRIAQKTNISIIDIQGKIPLNKSSDFFCDYCHPLEPANKIIFEEFKKIINNHQKTNRSKWSIFSDKRTPSDSAYPVI